MIWKSYPPYVYPGKAIAQRWIEGEEETIRLEIADMIYPARLVVIGAVLAELFNTSEPHAERFVSLVLNNELGECMTCEHQRCRFGKPC
jgi:hypothetical protein